MMKPNKLAELLRNRKYSPFSSVVKVKMSDDQFDDFMPFEGKIMRYAEQVGMKDSERLYPFIDFGFSRYG